MSETIKPPIEDLITACKAQLDSNLDAKELDEKMFEVGLAEDQDPYTTLYLNLVVAKAFGTSLPADLDSSFRNYYLEKLTEIESYTKDRSDVWYSVSEAMDYAIRCVEINGERVR